MNSASASSSSLTGRPLGARAAPAQLPHDVGDRGAPRSRRRAARAGSTSCRRPRSERGTEARPPPAAGTGSARAERRARGRRPPIGRRTTSADEQRRVAADRAELLGVPDVAHEHHRHEHERAAPWPRARRRASSSTSTAAGCSGRRDEAELLRRLSQAPSYRESKVHSLRIIRATSGELPRRRCEAVGAHARDDSLTVAVDDERRTTRLQPRRGEQAAPRPAGVYPAPAPGTDRTTRRPRERTRSCRRAPSAGLPDARSQGARRKGSRRRWGRRTGGLLALGRAARVRPASPG